MTPENIPLTCEAMASGAPAAVWCAESGWPVASQGCVHVVKRLMHLCGEIEAEQ